jgi:putative MATE family efflux protein
MEAEVIAEGAPYMRIMFVGAAAMTFRMLAEGIMQSSGDTLTPMRISILFRAFHTALCPFLVFGLWIFPQLGVRGAALTNVLSQSLGLGLGIWILFSGRTRLRLTLSGFQLDLNMIWRIVRIGIPAAIIGMQMGLIHIVMMSFMVPYGTLAVASHMLGQRLEMLMVTLLMGLGMGAGVLVGQNLGAGRPERAEKTGWLALGIAEGLMVLGSLVLLLGAEQIIKIFNTDPPLVALAGSFLRIAAVGYLVIASIAIMKHLLAGAGDTVPAMIFEIGHLWVVMLPLAYILPRYYHLGVYGIRWAIVTGVYAGAAAYLIYFQMGKWKKKRV